MIKNDDMLDKYNKIWDKIKNKLNFIKLKSNFMAHLFMMKNT